MDELAETRAKLVYITPSHQLPTEVVMPIQQRYKILQWAEKTGAIIIEDDYNSEFRYNAQPIQSLQSIDNFERIIYAGTFSKALAPGLRMSYMVLPKWLLPDYHSLFHRYKSAVRLLQQKIMERFMAQGYWEKHLRRISASNRKKHDILVHTVTEKLGDKVLITGNNAGLHILLEFINGEDSKQMVGRATEYGVKVFSTRHLWHDPQKSDDNLIIMGFGTLSKEEIVEGIKILRQAWE